MKPQAAWSRLVVSTADRSQFSKNIEASKLGAITCYLNSELHRVIAKTDESDRDRFTAGLRERFKGTLLELREGPSIAIWIRDRDRVTGSTFKTLAMQLHIYL